MKFIPKVKRNPVAKQLRTFGKPKVVKSKVKYKRKDKHATIQQGVAGDPCVSIRDTS